MKTFGVSGLALLSLVLGMNVAAAEKSAAGGSYRLIAHRGGVVEEQFPDNSRGALEAALARGYWMLEVDIRETKDGVAVMRHDPDLKLYHDDARKVQDLTWAELQPLRSKLADQPLLRFEELVIACKGKVFLMLDTKDPHTPDFPARIEAILRRHGMLESCYVIGTTASRRHFLGKARVGANQAALKAALAEDPKAKDRYFLFEHGNRLDAEKVSWAKANGVKIVPTVNIFHYYDQATMAKLPPAEVKQLILAAARRDIERLKAEGIREFQIDSEFDGWFGR